MRKLFFPLLVAMFLCRCISAQTAGDYQTISGGTWSTAGIWQTYNGAAWIAAGVAPNSTNGVITIQPGNIVNISTGITIDQVVVNGMLILKNVALTIANGAGDDLIINNVFEDSSNTSITWSAGAQWSIAAGGTLIRTTASSSAFWQNNYSTPGIATIPSTANWVLRKSGSANPAITTIGGIYPNMTFENKNAANWVTTVASTFNGGGAPLIKGNLDIGGSLTGTVDFLMNTTAASCVLVNGNVTVRTGNKLRDFGTGLEVQGDLTVNGDINHVGGTGSRKLVFSGSNTQTVSGTGNLNIYALEVNKSGGTVNLSRTIYIDNSGTFTAGTITSTTTYPVVFDNNATVTSIAATSFVNGPVVKYDNGASGNFTYPVGKISDYQALAIGGAAESAFWTEAFSNGCGSGCGAGTYTGPNGTWSTSSTGANAGFSNIWYVSYAEDGNSVGVCGTAGTNVDPSLHLGSQTAGDIGAAYDAGGLCGFGFCVTTNTRTESPTINCTGRSNMIVTFNYLEFGSGSTDNGTMWYFDGTTWSQLVDLPKTYCCGGVNCTGFNQGLWTNYRIALPASANNNANVKIGFNWTNNDDGVGTDPSFAIDDISIADNYWRAEYFYANPQVVYNNNLAPTLFAISSCDYWLLDRNASAGSKTVQLTWDANTCLNIVQTSDTRVAHYDQITTNIWQDEGNSATTGTTAAGTVTSAAAVTYFSPFTVSVIQSVLPIKLVDFNGSCTEGGVMLNWTTASETNNDFFSVERSTDGANYNEVGRTFGAGNSDHDIVYHFTDESPGSSLNYYRLRQVDFNGASEAFYPIAVNTTDCGNTGLDLLNTFIGNDMLVGQYSGAKGTVHVEIYDMNGKCVAVDLKENESGNFSFTSENWSNGIYVIRATDGFSSVSRTVVK